MISTVASSGRGGISGPGYLALDGAGNLYISDVISSNVRKLSSGVITTVAGIGSSGFSGDGGPATSAQLTPHGLAVDSIGNLYIADRLNNRVRKVAPNGIITTVAGNGGQGFSGDGGPATSARLFYPYGVAIDEGGNLLIAEVERIRKVSPDGLIRTVAGNGGSLDFSGEDVPATETSINSSSIAMDNSGTIYLIEVYNNRILILTPPVTVQPRALTFGTYQIGGSSTPSQQRLTITGSSATNLAVATVTSGASWLSLSATSIALPGLLNVSVNPAGLPPGSYVGNVRFNDSVDVPVTLTVLASCTIGVTPTSLSVPAGGIQSSLAVNASSVCAWTASSNVPWIRITSSINGTGPGYLSFEVAANTGPARTGRITVSDDKVFVVTQADATGAAPGLQFVPMVPCRAADTRSTVRMNGGESRIFALSSANCGIPSNAAAYSLNVTAVPAGPLSYLTLWPAGQPRPLVSTLNSFDGRIKANAAIMPAGLNGSVSVFVTDATDVVLDVNGYFVSSDPEGTAYYSVPLCRMADTRIGNGWLAGGLSPAFLNNCEGIFQTAQAYSLNFTAVPLEPLSYLTVWPAGSAQPLVSTLNAPTGTVTANAALIRAGTGGAISLFTTNDTHVVIDVNGYFGLPGGAGALLFYPVSPCRISDTRLATGAFGGPVLTSSQARTYIVSQSGCQIPSSARAYSLNVTALPQGQLSFLTLWPSDVAQPLVSTLNSFDGTVVSNAAIVPAAANGAISVFVSDTAHVILDINGYFQ